MKNKKAGDSAERRSKPAKKKKFGKSRKPTKRQADLIKGVIAGKSVHRSALDAGYASGTAEHASKLLSSEVLREFCQRRLSLDKVLQRVDEGMDATSSETVIIGRKGHESVSFHEAPDFGERRQAAALAAKLIGADPSNKIEVKGDVNNFVRVEFVNVDGLREA